MFELAHCHPSSLTPLPSPSLTFPLFFALLSPPRKCSKSTVPTGTHAIASSWAKDKFFFSFLFSFFSFTDLKVFVLPSSACTTFTMAIARRPSRGHDASEVHGADIATTSPSHVPRMPPRKLHQRHFPAVPPQAPLHSSLARCSPMLCS